MNGSKHMLGERTQRRGNEVERGIERETCGLDCPLRCDESQDGKARYSSRERRLDGIRTSQREDRSCTGGVEDLLEELSGGKHVGWSVSEPHEGHFLTVKLLQLQRIRRSSSWHEARMIVLVVVPA